MSKRRHPPRGRLAVAAIALVTTVVAFGGMAGSAPGQQLTTINVDTLAIANGLPLTLGINKGFFAAQGLEIKPKNLRERQRHRARDGERRRRRRIHGLHPGDDRAYAGGCSAERPRRQRDRGSDGSRQLAERRGRRVELDPHAKGPRRQDNRSERAQGCHRARRQGGARQARHRLELGEVRDDAIPDDAGGTRERPGRRDPHARAVHVAGPRARRSDRPGSRSGHHPVLAERLLLRARGLDGKESGAREAVPGSDQPVADVLEQPPRRGPGAPPRLDSEHPPPQLEPAARPLKARPARWAGEEVRHPEDAPKHDDVRAEVRRGRHFPERDGRSKRVPRAETGREGRGATTGRQGHDRGRRQVLEGQLPSERRWCRPVDERGQEAAGHVDHHVEEGRLPFLVQREL